MPELAAPPAVAGGLESWIDGIEAACADPSAEQSVAVAGAPVLVRYGRPEIHARLSRALAHLPAAGVGRPALTVHAWDSEGPEAPVPPLPETDPGEPRGAVFYAASAGRHVAYQPGLGLMSAYDSHRGLAWFWCRSADRLPFWEPAAPFRQILHWWLAGRGLLLLHGAGVGYRDGGVLLVGRGGSGKSTCALSSLASGLLYAGDDYVAVAPGAEPRVFSLFSSGKLEPGHAARLRHLPDAVFEAGGVPGEKAVFYVGARFADRMCESFPLRAVVVPRIRGDAARVERIPPARALHALAPSTLLQLVPARREALSAMAGLLERVPSYSLDVGGPVERIPAALESLLAEAER